MINGRYFPDERSAIRPSHERGARELFTIMIIKINKGIYIYMFYLRFDSQQSSYVLALGGKYESRNVGRFELRGGAEESKGHKDETLRSYDEFKVN